MTSYTNKSIDKSDTFCKICIRLVQFLRITFTII
nr:MAG TPA: hypothetical protein [Caudoviricetes sp.]